MSDGSTPDGPSSVDSQRALAILLVLAVLFILVVGGVGYVLAT